MKLAPSQPINGSANATIFGATQPANQWYAVNFQAISTGTVVGSVKLQYSNDNTLGNAASVVNWLDVPSSSVAVASAGVVGSGVLTTCYLWVRQVWTYTSGSGTIIVNQVAQQV